MSADESSDEIRPDEKSAVIAPDSSAAAPTSSLLTRASWLLCAVPLIAVIELVLHVKQTGADVVPEEDWSAAREVVKAELQPDDLVLFEPFWSDALGRRSFGDGIASIKREGRSDRDRWKRAWEVSIRGAHDEEIAKHWKAVKTEKKGAITITLYENPEPSIVIDDLIDLVTPDRLQVALVGNEGRGDAPCSFQRGATAGGSTVVPQGLLTPADKFVCGGGHVGVAVMHALDHHPHLCIYATPIASGSLRLRFTNVTFGASVVGHSGLQWMSERTPAPDKLTVTFSAAVNGDSNSMSALGVHLHKVGAGWTGFELPTPDLDGKRGDLIAEIAPSSQRQFCFEATTRHRKGSPGGAP